MNRFSFAGRRMNQRGDREAGFTLLESVIVIFLLAAIASIAAPSWIRFVENRRVALAIEELHQAIQAAQRASQTQRTSWRFSLREHNGVIEWAIHPNTQAASTVTTWDALSPSLQLDPADTTLASAQGIYYVRFGYRGEVVHRLSTVTLQSQSGIAKKRCVVISTLIGATRRGQEQLYPNSNNRYCY